MRVDTGRWEGNLHLDKKNRLCLVYQSSQHVRGGTPFVCTAILKPGMQVLFSKLPRCHTLLLGVKQKHLLVSWGINSAWEQYLTE